ncbi:MAG: hypothetical protein H6737_17320 [Alphaproteobacteria bacterium]|nr:hypothetical protein [Alphaproteobacteria bacterium]
MIRALAAVAIAIAVADLAQVVWLGKGLGAIGGAVIYTGVAVGALRGVRLALWVGLMMPVIPLSVFAGLAGAQARETLVDTGMIAVFTLQVTVAVLAAATLRPPGAGERGEMR